MWSIRANIMWFGAQNTGEKSWSMGWMTGSNLCFKRFVRNGDFPSLRRKSCQTMCIC